MHRSCYYVIINDEQLARLRELIRHRYRFSGRIQLNRIERNAVIKAESLSIQILDWVSPEVAERIHELIHGFIVGADLKSSTDDL